MVSSIFQEALRIVVKSEEVLGNRKISHIMGKYDHWLTRNLQKNEEYEFFMEWKTRFYDARKKRKEIIDRMKWNSVQPRCEKCGKVMTVKYGSGRFCSRQCANSHIQTSEIRKKISEGVRKELSSEEGKRRLSKLDKENEKEYLKSPNRCIVCGGIIPWDVRSRKTCSEKCLKENMSKRVRWNIHRNQSSFAEKFFSVVLDNNGISYKREFPVKKEDGRHCYFLDFLIEIKDRKIDLEIDGSQHLYRKDLDTIRDEYLRREGYVVYRIPWNEIKSEQGKKKMKEKIEKMLLFLKTPA
jgi:hypothetical protein